MDRHEDARRLNSEVGLVGLRAHATAVGLLQLCTELLDAGVLDNAAITRIKSAIADQITVSYTPHRGREAFEASLHRRLDNLFPTAGPCDHPAGTVGTSREMGDGLNFEDAD